MEEKKITSEQERTRKFVKVAAALVLAYAVGCKVTTFRINQGIARCWKADPTLKDHMWDAAVKVLKE